MTAAIILKAILMVAPWLPQPVALGYAKIIRAESARREIHPFLFVAFATVESTWNPRAKSTTADFGLLQVHVAKNGSDRFLGREEQLFDPRTNIREWGRIAAMWEVYHNRECGVKVQICYSGPEGPWGCTHERMQSHEWWGHLKWGYVIKDHSHSLLVGAIFETLLKRFGSRMGET